MAQQTVLQQPGGTTVVSPFRFEQNWSTGLFNCCDDCGNCCYAFFCQPCFICSLAKTINEPAVSCCCVPNYLTAYRTKVRSVFRIEGDVCNDCMVASCCALCASLQIEAELKHQGLV